MALFVRDPNQEVLDLFARCASLPREKQELLLSLVQTYVSNLKR